MIIMSTTYRVIFALSVFCKFVHGRSSAGDVCTLQSTGGPGECKLFSDCQPALHGLQKYNKFPQICGFNGTQPIVCCIKAKERIPGEISKRKCKEYSRYVLEKRRSPVLLQDAPEILRNACGHKVVKLIVGEEPATRTEFPHMVAIGFEPTPDNIQWLCGGTILNKEYILTAAHCLNDSSRGNAQWVKLGVADLMDTKNVQQIRIAERIPYPQYNSSSHYHDIGLIRLANPAKLNPYARPACLHLEPDVSTKKAIATGWDGQSSKLRKFTIDLFDHDYCNASYKNQISGKLKNGIVKDMQLCAGSEEDICQADSGGPLQIFHIGDNVRCMYDIVGVASFGKGCPGSPGVYARVFHYVKWIEDIIWP